MSTTDEKPAVVEKVANGAEESEDAPMEEVSENELVLFKRISRLLL